MKASELKNIIREELSNVLREKAESESQQMAAGIALAVKRGKLPKSALKGASKAMYDMSEKELEKYAGTKHKGIPYKVSEAEEAAPVAPSGDRSLEILDKIKKLTKALQKQQTIRNNAAAQRLNAKFTGMLGKMTSYINQQLTPETPEESGEENV